MIRSNLFPALQESRNFSSAVALSDGLPTAAAVQREEVLPVPQPPLLHCRQEANPWAGRGDRPGGDDLALAPGVV